MKQLASTLYLIIAIITAMIGYEIHHNTFYAIIDFLFWPIAWAYWLIKHDINIIVIKDTFSFFFNPKSK